MTKKKIISFIAHILLFIGVEVLFVFMILREVPHIEFVSVLGCVHVIYWFVVILAGIFREKVKKLWVKVILSYFPVIFHVIGHIYVGLFTVEHVAENMKDHPEHSLTWLIITTLSAGILIAVGERLLHRKIHCDSCHSDVHKHCHE